MARAFQVNLSDNVATLLDDASAGEVAIVGRPEPARVLLAEPIALGHKVAIAPIPAGTEIRKFGQPIGIATVAIPAGGWVHLHNCRSALDERSSTLDARTGAATDTVYG